VERHAEQLIAEPDLQHRYLGRGYSLIHEFGIAGCRWLYATSPLVGYGISRFESGDRHFFGLLSRIRDRKFRDSSKVAAVIQCRLDDIQGDDDAV